MAHSRHDKGNAVLHLTAPPSLMSFFVVVLIQSGTWYFRYRSRFRTAASPWSVLLGRWSAYISANALTPSSTYLLFASSFSDASLTNSGTTLRRFCLPFRFPCAVWRHCLGLVGLTYVPPLGLVLLLALRRFPCDFVSWVISKNVLYVGRNLSASMGGLWAVGRSHI